VISSKRSQKKTKTNKRQYPLSSVRVRDPWRQIVIAVSNYFWLWECVMRCAGAAAGSKRCSAGEWVKSRIVMVPWRIGVAGIASASVTGQRWDCCQQLVMRMMDDHWVDRALKRSECSRRRCSASPPLSLSFYTKFVLHCAISEHYSRWHRGNQEAEKLRLYSSCIECRASMLPKIF